MFRLLTKSILALTIAGSMIGGTNSVSAAQQRERCFQQTGFCVSGSILDYWERNGGLPVFGYPITAQRNETIEGSWNGPVQWFERDRLEDHANEGQGVLAGRLGASYLELRGTPWKPGARGTANSDCVFFEPTNHTACGMFLRYWKDNGGLARFGYPISDAMDEVIEGKTYQVQYFERRRMELHPENAGTPYEVQLGLLGRDIYKKSGDANVTPVVSGDISADIQQRVLNSAWAAIKPRYAKINLAIGLVGVDGSFASARAVPQGKKPLFVYLQQSGNGWTVIQAEAAPSVAKLRQLGVPETLITASDAGTIAEIAAANLATSVSGYLTKARVSGDYARFWQVPMRDAPLDPATVFFKRENGTWKQLSAGTAFPEDSLKQLGIPQDLWPAGETVNGPQ